ncbi:hypothetical protein [Bradyrhizobium sp. cf659]|uniref:hypothetical protein n=1 Tax=Bradyrhizobium sp. cf659 TaxID=1761771 RepID=UPI0008EDBC88|nr:hypothetical protein [Bradyrhizobium sp. cf659]SFI59089.1 hypothetical protein SAMN04487925_103392 [Bradyrhizobium sp. cf659]
MAQQVLGGIADNVSLEGRGGSEAELTFDHLLRAYFARLLVGEFPAMSDVSRSLELPSAPRNSLSRSN